MRNLIQKIFLSKLYDLLMVSLIGVAIVSAVFGSFGIVVICMGIVVYLGASLTIATYYLNRTAPMPNIHDVVNKIESHKAQQMQSPQVQQAPQAISPEMQETLERIKDMRSQSAQNERHLLKMARENGYKRIKTFPADLEV